MNPNDFAAALRAAGIDYRRNIPLTPKHQAPFGLMANNQLVALVALALPSDASWPRTRAYLQTGLPVFAVPDRTPAAFVRAWVDRDFVGLTQYRVPLRGTAPSV